MFLFPEAVVPTVSEQSKHVMLQIGITVLHRASPSWILGPCLGHARTHIVHTLCMAEAW